MTAADRLAALRAVPACAGHIAIENMHDSPAHTAFRFAYFNAETCDDCFTLLVDAVIAHAVEGLTVPDLATLTGLDPMASPALAALARDELRSALTRGSR